MQSLRIIVNKNPLFGKCPDCKSGGSLHRSRARNFTEKLIKKTTFFKTYRCRECGWRGFRSTLTITKASFRNFMLILFIALIAAFFISVVIKRVAL